MNLEESVRWMKDRAAILKEEERPLLEQITNAKFACWLDELQRYRLFLSEYQREIELTPEKNKAEQIKLLKDEIKDWRLEERVE
ncbi:MAG: hypothetical protein II003_03565 [Methanobrevibacter sp.]|nr:hypothetical protein [Methanobrevibacter sp.]